MASASTDAAEIRRRGRQRLIGAVAIVLLLVVFIPMLLDSEPRKSADEPPLDIPSKDNAPPLPAPVPASSAAKPVAAAAAPAATAPAATPAATTAKTPAPPAGASAKAEPAEKGDVKTVAPAEPAAAIGKPGAGAPSKSDPRLRGDDKAATPRLEGFAVQVGAFRDEAKLKHARDQLAAAGVPHYTERLDSASGGPLTRLRAGPFPTRQAADGAAAKLKAAQLPAQVVPLP